MSIEEKHELQRQIDALLAKPSLTPSERKQCDLLMSKAASLRSDEERRARAAKVLEEIGLPVPVIEEASAVTGEKREAAKRFRDLLVGQSLRTYTPMSKALQSQTLAQGFERDIKALMLSDGPFFAGSSVLSSISAQRMNSSKLPVSDDLSSTGYVLVENVGPATDEAELNFTSVLFGSSTFSSGIVLVSTSLADDLEAWITAEGLVKRTAAARLSRIMNATWLPALKTALAANSSASVAAGVAFSAMKAWSSTVCG